MPRCTADEVINQLQQDYDADNRPELTVPIRRANLIVNRVQTCATGKGITMLDAELKEVEIMVAAHYYTAGDKPYNQRNTAEAAGQFETATKKDAGLGETRHGRDAMAFDYSGCLTNFNLKQRASMRWLGKPVSAQIDYEQRD